MGSHQRFQRFTVRRQNNHRVGGQPGHHDFPSQLPIRHATAPPIRLLFCCRKAASLILPSYLHARRSRNFRLAVLVAGQIDVSLGAPTELPLMRSGRIKALAVTTDARLPQAPDLPSFAELGLPSLSFSAWFGLFAPKGTPK